MDSFTEMISGWRTISALSWLAILLASETATPFFSYFVSVRRQRISHGVRNLVLGILNSVSVALGFVALWWAAAEWSNSKHFGLFTWLSLPGWARLILACLLFDMWMYWWHRLNHRIGFFWRFHRTHHSDPRMDVTTANRFHFG